MKLDLGASREGVVGKHRRYQLLTSLEPETAAEGDSARSVIGPLSSNNSNVRVNGVDFCAEATCAACSMVQLPLRSPCFLISNREPSNVIDPCSVNQWNCNVD